MHIMCITDSDTSGTGFGEQMRHNMYRLVQNGHEVSWLGLQYYGRPIFHYDHMFEDLPHKNAKVRMLGITGQSTMDYGASVFVKHFKDWTPDLVFLMGDPHMLEPYVQLKQKLGFPLLFYVTLDGTPLPPVWKQYLGLPNILVTMTNWPRQEYEKFGFPSNTVPHGIPWMWWATSKEQREKAKEQYGIDKDTVIVANWDVNQHRKRLDALLRCWKKIKPQHLNAKLLLYTNWKVTRLGWDIEDLIKQYDVPRHTVLSPYDIEGQDKFWEGPAKTPSELKNVVQIGDCYASTTSGEGFGVCLAEAQALGMPVVATDCSSIPEVVKTGFRIPVAYRYRGPDSMRGVEAALVDEDEFAEALYTLVANNGMREDMGLKARESIRCFDFDLFVTPLWLRLLDKVNPDLIFAQEVLNL